VQNLYIRKQSVKLSYKIKLILIGYLFIILISGCSTKRNTSSARAYHELTTRYNIYYNAEKTYNNLIEEQQKNITDNWYKLLTIFPVTPNKNKTQHGGPFDIVISKAVEAIQKHSITSRPRRDPSKAESSNYRQWLKQEEYNSSLKNVWLLMGKAHVQNGDYEDAISVFTEIIRLYPYDIDLISESQIWMMRCYSEMNRMYDAENMSIILRSRKLPEKLNRYYIEAYTHVLLQKKQYNEALPYIKRLIESERNFYQKKRLQFIVGQIYTILDDYDRAYHAFEEIKGLRTPYILSSVVDKYRTSTDSLKLILQQGFLADFDTEGIEHKSTSTFNSRSENISNNLSQWRAFQIKDFAYKSSDTHCYTSDNLAFTAEKNTPHILLLQSACTPLNENKELNNLLFATANFNFTIFKLRTFNLYPIYLKQGNYLSIEQFYSFDDAMLYLQQLKTDSIFKTSIPGNISTTIISKENLKIVRTIGSLDQYKEFSNIDEFEQIEKNVSLKTEFIPDDEPVIYPKPAPNKQELSPTEIRDDRVDPVILKRELERKAEEAIKQSERVSDKKNRNNILLEREKARKQRVKQKELEIKERIRKREAALKARELEREKKIKEQELRRKGILHN